MYSVASRSNSSSSTHELILRARQLRLGSLGASSMETSSAHDSEEAGMTRGGGTC